MKANKIILITTVLASTLLLANTCYKDGHDCITIVNKSDKTLKFQLFNDYMDTVFYCSQHGITILGAVKADSLFSLMAPDRDMWEYYFDNENRILSIDVGESTYDYDQYIPCDTISKYIPIAHHYRLTLEDLNRMNWTIVYPPEE
jgi:hypothetical protein